MTLALFSIVIPTHNRAAKISRALNSVLSQESENWELIIADDGSTDNTESAIQPFLSDPRIKYCRQENRGVGAARNFGASQAKGDFLAFLDSDDELRPGWLADFNGLVESTVQRVGYVSCGFSLEGKDFPPKRRDWCPYPYSSNAGTFALTREIFEQIGGYDEALRQSENYEMAARAVTACMSAGMSIMKTNRANAIWHHQKSEAEHIKRDLLRAEAYLHLYKKYKDGGVFQPLVHRFLLGAAVNYTRAGRLREGRKWFRRSFCKHPSLKALLRIICFEIPPLRKKVWLDQSNSA